MTTTIAVFGAGAIGCWLGGRLASGGAAVTLIGRPRVHGEIANGLCLTELNGPPHQLGVLAAGAAPVESPHVFATTDPGIAATATVTLVSVKSAQTAEAGATLARVLPDGALVVSMQNGVRNAGILREALPGRVVLTGMVPWNVARLGPGAYHRGSSGTLMIGNHTRGAPLYKALGAAAITYQTRTDMLAVQWAKLLLNLNNAINALSGLPLAAELSQRSFRRCLAHAQREAIELIDAANMELARLTVLPPRWMPRMLELPDGVFRLLAAKTVAIDPQARSSMWDDLEAKRPTEIDQLQGEVVELGQRLERPVPINATLLRLIREAEAGGKRDFTGDELLAALSSGSP
ncbi:MAG: 2-dehydropantoate 2-reductase [Deltaproteobacteria bacterium]|nr:2-dehydropantoate 2-reductase [Deltaproteobacteria bacterium]